MKPKKFAFVLMPFEDAFNDIYIYGIKQACTEVDAYCERVDEQIFHERILDRIYNQVSKADIIVADMTGRNANVFYEVGYAHGLGKSVILITHNADDIPFDLKHFPHIIYNGEISTLHQKLKEKLSFFLDDENSKKVQDFEFGLEFSIDGQKIEEDAEIVISAEYLAGFADFYTLSLDIHNTGHRIFDSQFKIAFSTSTGEEEFNGEKIKTSDGKTLSLSKELAGIYPKGYLKHELSISPKSLGTKADRYLEKKIIDVTFEVFTSFERKTINCKFCLMPREYSWV